MIGGAALLADAASRCALDEVGCGNVDVEDARELEPELLEDAVEGVRLLDRPREAVKDEAFLAVVLGEALAHDTDGHAVRYELALVHIALGLAAEGRAFLDRRTEHVARGDMGNGERLDKFCRLGAFAGARRAHQ